jgi:hypothetical protein
MGEIPESQLKAFADNCKQWKPFRFSSFKIRDFEIKK